MANPKIEWYVKEDSAYTPRREHYAGSYRPEDDIEMHIRAWSNRFGTEKHPDIENPVLIVYFSTIEDSAFLEYIRISADGKPSQKPDILDKKAYYPLNREKLSGAPNEGTEEYADNYVDIVLSFDLKGAETKDTDLKNLFLEIAPQ